MNKLCGLIFAVVLLSVTLASAQRYIGEQSSEVIVPKVKGWQGCGETNEALKITTFTTNPPYGWREWGTNGFMVANGFGIDLMKQIAQEEKILLTTVGFKSDQAAREAFENGKVDLYVGLYYDPKIRENGHSYLMPAYIPNVITAVFLKNKARAVNSFDDLKGLKGAVRQDEQFYPYVRLTLPPDLEIEEVPNSKEAFTKLITGEVDYLLSSPYASEAEARRFKINRHLAYIGTPIMGQELFVVYSKNSPCPQYRRTFIKKLAERRKDKDALNRTLINFIDTWGQRFKDEPSLIDQLKAEGRIPKDFTLHTQENKSESSVEQKE